MLKGKRIISENLSRVDALIELVDSRVPLASLNHDLYSSSNKSARAPRRILVLNKCDLAEKEKTTRWVELFRRYGVPAMGADSLSGASGINRLIRELQKIHEIKKDDARRGAITSTLHVMVVGLPNVGKSSLINRLSSHKGQEPGATPRKGKARTGASPGVTRGGQWLKVAKGLEILDTPGVLFPRMSSRAQGVKLALIAAITDRVLDEESVAEALLTYLASVRPEILTEKFGLQLPEGIVLGWEKDDTIRFGQNMLRELSIRLGKFHRGGDIDTLSGAIGLLSEFRKGGLGRITLESPEDFPTEMLQQLIVHG
jgi:ribosome biogenesis GTPase A